MAKINMIIFRLAKIDGKNTFMQSEKCGFSLKTNGKITAVATKNLKNVNVIGGMILRIILTRGIIAPPEKAAKIRKKTANRLFFMITRPC